MEIEKTESNNSSNIKEINNKNPIGYFPLLKFKENLYNSCQSKYSEFINSRKSDIKLIIDNKTNQQITLDDYISNYNFSELTPIPFINKRKIKNSQENKELKNYQRNAVLMRRIEYENKMKQNKLKKKYDNQKDKIIYLQKIIRGYLVRKVIKQVKIIQNTLSNFIFLINICIIKRYYYNFKKNIYEINKIKNEKINNITNVENQLKLNSNINGGEDKTIKKDSHNDKYANIKEHYIKTKCKNENVNNDYNKIEENNLKENNLVQINNCNKNKKSMAEIIDKIDNFNSLLNNSKSEKTYHSKNNHINKINIGSNQTKEINPDSIIENDCYIDFSNKGSHQIESKSNGNKNSTKAMPNRNPKNDLITYYLSDISSSLAIKKTKTETIQRQFRKYLSKKGYYGKFDKRIIAIIFLIKNMIIFSIRPYILNILKLNYKRIKNITITQEENYFNITTERINNVKRIYNAAKKEIK